MKANFHTHTFRCNHASGTEREYIELAIAAGLEVLGFSDHTPYIFEDGHYSNFRMRPEELDGYVATLQALREEYKKDIRICIGLETEYYPRDWEKYLCFLHGKGIEYMILGQHYAVEETPGALYSARASDSEKRLFDYVDNVVRGAQTGLFSYIAHPDAIHFTGDEKIFRKELDRMVKAVKNEGLPFEINLLGLREGRNYPCELFLEVLRENDATVILGSDAHTPAHVYDKVTINRALELTEKYHLKVTESLDLDRLKRKGIEK